MNQLALASSEEEYSPDDEGMRWPSASKLWLSEKCGYSFTTLTKWPDDPPGPAAKFGIAAGRCAELYVLGKEYSVANVAKENDILDRLEDLTNCDSDFRHILDCDQFEWRVPECFMAVHVETLDVRRADSHRDKRKGETLIGPDLVFKDLNGALWVRDWKCARKSDSHWTQEKAGAFAAQRLFGADECVLELVYWSKSGPLRLKETLDGFDLETIQAWFSQHMKRLPMMTEPTPGAHCHDGWCGARAICEAAPPAPRRYTKRKVA